MKYLKVLLLFLIVACSSPKIVYDYDTQENFDQYKTFKFFEDAGNGLTDFDITRIKTAIENQLSKQGIKQDSVPDFFINFSTKERKENSRNTVGVGIGGGGGNVGFGISGGIPIGGKRINQQLTIDFVSAEEDQLFWQSISESLLKEKTKPEERTKHYQTLITKVFSTYPPKKKK